MRRPTLLIVSFLALLLSGVCFGSGDVRAQPKHRTCDNIQNTADVMVCANKRHDEAQKSLGNVFEEILEQHRGDKAGTDALWTIQRGWIKYRDQECTHQASAVETETLKRIQELTCLSALTEQRARILSLSFSPVRGKQQAERETLPLWMNVVANDAPDVFWKYGAPVRGDFDCDGDAEEVLLGHKAGGSFVVALAETPRTGRPKVSFVPFSAKGEKSCYYNPSLFLVDYPEYGQNLEPASGGDGTVEMHDAPQTPRCTVALQVVEKNCDTQLLYWAGEGYTLVLPPLGELEEAQ